MTAATYHFTFIFSSFIAFGIGIALVSILSPHDY